MPQSAQNVWAFHHLVIATNLLAPARMSSKGKMTHWFFVRNIALVEMHGVGIIELHVANTSISSPSRGVIIFLLLRVFRRQETSHTHSLGAELKDLSPLA